MFPDMFSYAMSPTEIRLTGDFLFQFTEGDWETATPIMESGCGILIAPMLAARLDLVVGDRLMVPGKSGDVECTVAGIGTSIGFATIVSLSAADEFNTTPPIEAAVIPRIGVDDATVKGILEEQVAPYPSVHAESFAETYEVMVTMTDGLTSSLNGILVIAVLAAALGFINTTMMSVQERRHELGLIRAVGATRRQVRSVVMGEAALMGLVGAIIGVIAGAGMTIIFVVTYGGNSVGLDDLPLWSTALEVLRPVLVTGIVGLIVAPLISALSAWLPTRNLLKGAAIETLHPVR
jgi:putative ABC transport system permease protein